MDTHARVWPGERDCGTAAWALYSGERRAEETVAGSNLGLGEGREREGGRGGEGKGGGGEGAAYKRESAHPCRRNYTALLPTATSG